MSNQPIKVLIVDDSKTSIKILEEIFKIEPRITIVGMARNGLEAIEWVEKLAPDIVTMDINMPVMDGIDAISHIMHHHPVPIVVISVYAKNENSEKVFQALDAGALTVLDKPDSIYDSHFKMTADKINQTILALAQAKLVTRRSRKPRNALPTSHKHYELVALGASTGGPICLRDILSVLHQDFPLPIVIVQHIASGFTEGFVNWLQSHCAITLKLAKNGEVLSPATAYIAPDGKHMLVGRNKDQQKVLLLTDDAPVNHSIPSVTRLFDSIADSVGERAIAGLLTGMGSDGASGLLAIRSKGGCTFTQSEETCTVFGMPKTAIMMDAAKYVLSPSEIAQLLTEYARKNAH